MRLQLSWVRDFVDVRVPADAIAETLALRGFEVASVESLPDGDAVIDFEVTANRPDCLGVLGFAREIATTYDLPLRLPGEAPDATIRLAPVESGVSSLVRVTIEDADLCPRYAAAVVEVTATTTPAWMAARLQATGVRPISPFVDITNYVLMELGHPMHAFDLDRLEGRTLRVRRASAGERLTTLDGVERRLDADMLVIADASHAQAIAGVMGGRASEVSPATRTVVFESAYFMPASIRRTSKRAGLKSEASARFERGTDINAPVVALQRALALMEQIGAGRLLAPIVDEYPAPRAPRLLHLRRDRLTQLLGMSVPEDEVGRILRSLALSPVVEADGWQVRIPTFRVDLSREVDLIEEVGRHHGFDKLQPAFPAMSVAAAAPDPRVARDRLARRILTAAGATEAVTFGFIEGRSAETFVPGEDTQCLVRVANPLSAKFDVLRPSLLPGLLDAVAHNRRHGRRDVALFEIGARFDTRSGETRGLAVIWTGAAEPEHWSGSGREVDFFDLKGAATTLGSAVGATLQFVPAGVAFLVPGHAARILAGDAVVGLVGRLAPAVVDRAGAPRQDAVFVLELNLDALQARARAPHERVAPLPRHPSVVRDLSVIVSESLPAEIIHGTIQAAAQHSAAPLVGVTVFDRYQGKGLPPASISLSVRLTFQAIDRTLTDADVQQAFDRILAALVQEHGATQR